MTNFKEHDGMLFKQPKPTFKVGDGGGEMKPAHYCQTLTHICTRKDIVSRGNYPNVISISCNDTLTIIGENAGPKQLDAIMDILEKNGEEE